MSQKVVEPQSSTAAWVFEEARSLGTKVIGRKPHQYPQLNKFGNRTNEICGLGNQEQLSRLMEYLHLNGWYELVPVKNRVSCVFAAIRRWVDVPREYTNTHLRRHIVMYVLQNVQFFFPLLRFPIMGNYGHTRLSSEEYAQKERDGILTPQGIADQRCSGPFSLYFYLQHVLIPSIWGEEIIITPVSMIWQIGDKCGICWNLATGESEAQQEYGYDRFGVGLLCRYTLHWCW